MKTNKFRKDIARINQALDKIYMATPNLSKFLVDRGVSVELADDAMDFVKTEYAVNLEIELVKTFFPSVEIFTTRMSEIHEKLWEIQSLIDKALE